MLNPVLKTLNLLLFCTLINADKHHLIIDSYQPVWNWFVILSFSRLTIHSPRLTIDSFPPASTNPATVARDPKVHTTRKVRLEAKHNTARALRLVRTYSRNLWPCRKPASEADGDADPNPSPGAMALTCVLGLILGRNQPAAARFLPSQGLHYWPFPWPTYPVDPWITVNALRIHTIIPQSPCFPCTQVIRRLICRSLDLWMI